MKLYNEGEYNAFEEIYARYNRHVYTYLKKRIKNPETVNDIFQNIFVKFHKSKALYDPKYELLKWIYTISRSELLDFLKKKNITTISLLEEFAVEIQEQEIYTLDIHSEKSLTDKEKSVIELRYFSEMDFLEISERLNTSQANIRKIISRAIKKLRIKYTGEIT